MKNLTITATLLGVVLVAAGCGKSSKDVSTSNASPNVPLALAAVFGDVIPSEALSAIPSLRQTAKPGDEVVLEVKVMGTKTPFVENRALFVVGDEGTMTSCDLLHGDQCATPWDNCCDDTKLLRAGTATIQVVDDNGSVVRQSIKGVSGLKELSRVRVAGKVAPNSTEAAFIINASKIQVL